ncbi:MAG TPA: NAD-dependent epimerase/dehydratase family protein [Fimbriimonadaceae bacterium]|nr:NAD-dependent epimerase/dehydratase family protein [Fimbriimonadaceae bacterium]
MGDSYLVTGGLGFIGSAFIRHVAPQVSAVVNVDIGTYAADEARVPASLGNVSLLRVDVASDELSEVVLRDRPDVVVHFAAETHVTRSEVDEDPFFRTNVQGTRQVLEACRTADVGTVVCVSTDEVYGPARERPFREEDKAPGEGRASSAYARSKALADDLACGFDASMRVIVVRPTNCYGPWQHPEKAIPRWTTRALMGMRLPVWGDGRYVRDWMYVDDVCTAISLLIRRSDASGVYNIGPGGASVPNIAIARMIAERAQMGTDAVYLTDYDRPQHDRRYSVDASKIRALGWEPKTRPEEGIRRTVEWYAAHREWWRDIVADAEALYQDEIERSS